MRRYLFILAMLGCITTVDAKIKVVDSSSKRAPEWNDGAAAESIIVSSVSEISVDDAKRRAVDEIKIKIVESIAQNVNSSSFSRIEQKSGDEESFTDEFTTALLVNSAKMPFISGISESKIEDYYWCIKEDTSTKRRQYIYSIKYPLSHAEVDGFIREFKAMDEEKSQELEMLQSGYYNVGSVAEIAEAISKCNELNNFFFDSMRKSATEELKARYNGLYNNISVVTQREELGSAYVALQIGDRKIASTRKPFARYDKDMIQDFKITPRDGGFEVSYDPQFCEENLPYVITMSVYIGNRSVAHTITFTKSKKAEVKIQPQGGVTLTAGDITSATLKNVQVQMELSVQGLPEGTPITIRNVVLQVPSLKDDLFLSKVSARYIGENRVSLLGINTTAIARTGASSTSTIKVLKGEIEGYYGEDYKPFKTNFSKTYRCNW